MTITSQTPVFVNKDANDQEAVIMFSFRTLSVSALLKLILPKKLKMFKIPLHPSFLFFDPRFRSKNYRCDHQAGFNGRGHRRSRCSGEQVVAAAKRCVCVRVCVC